MSNIFVGTWGMIRLLLKYDQVNFNRAAIHDLEEYLQLLEATEDVSIAALEFKENDEVNQASTKMPKEEENRGYLCEGVVKPPRKHWKCTARMMETTHYPLKI